MLFRSYIRKYQPGHKEHHEKDTKRQVWDGQTSDPQTTRPAPCSRRPARSLMPAGFRRLRARLDSREATRVSLPCGPLAPNRDPTRVPPAHAVSANPPRALSTGMPKQVSTESQSTQSDRFRLEENTKRWPPTIRLEVALVITSE